MDFHSTAFCRFSLQVLRLTAFNFADILILLISGKKLSLKHSTTVQPSALSAFIKAMEECGQRLNEQDGDDDRIFKRLDLSADIS